MFEIAYRLAKRIVIGIVGATVLAVGIAMLVLPGPAFVVIPIGLGILSLEFAWARRWLKAVKERGEALARSARSMAGGAEDAGTPTKPGEK